MLMDNVRSSRLPAITSVLAILAISGMVTSTAVMVQAADLPGLSLTVDYTPDSTTVSSAVNPGSKIDLTAAAPVSLAGTTTQEIIQDVPSSMNLTGTGDVKYPAGWTVYYSTDGVTWTAIAPTTASGWAAIRKVKANGPVISEGTDSSGLQISSADTTGNQPVTGSFPASAGASGDGWDVIFDDNNHVFNVFHHQPYTRVDCHLRTGERCGASWPFTLASVNPYNSSDLTTFQMAGSNLSSGWVDNVAKEFWMPTVMQIGTARKVGFVCLNLTTIDAASKWCGGSASTAFISPGATAEFTGTTCASSRKTMRWRGRVRAGWWTEKV